MKEINVTLAQYMYMKDQITCIKVITPNETLFVPFDPANSDYAEIMRQVEAGELTIEEAGE
jgi:hypothetical protein